MHSWEWLVIVLYGVAMSLIFFYSLMQLALLIRYRNVKQLPILPMPEEWPEVLVQLPVYNEFYVVERLIDAVALLDYPKEKLSIQVLDDSSDESAELARKRVDFWRGKGINIFHIQRENRKGFKAGALDYGLHNSNQDYIAIFDADFIPQPDFLKNTIPHFRDESIGMVQTRWAHLNRDYSLLTKVQAFALDAHFTVEQVGRNRGEHFINFNGTAGVWRRSCISEAGGWSPDTLTEDLDLSYRAQLRGWKFKYLEEVAAPAELPAEMNALKNQQFRWNKGAAECARKHLRQVLFKKGIKGSTRLHALFHLGNSSVFIWIVLYAILSFPLISLKLRHPELKPFFFIGSILFLSFAILAVYYHTSFRKVRGSSKGFLALYPAFLSLSMGMSLHNALAVLEGYRGKRSDFVRTPKWDLIGLKGTWRKKKYLDTKIPLLTWIEGLLCLYFLLALIYEIRAGEWGFIPLHLMLVFGFGAVFTYTLRHMRINS